MIMLARSWLFALLVGSAIASAPQLRLTTGVVQGERLASGVQVFRGVPYAEAPIGALRWAAPVAHSAWSGIRQATKFSPACAQINAVPKIPKFSFDLPHQSEDCLYLNIYAPPNAANNQTFPIMIFIHGGSFIVGSGAQYQYDGERLALTQNVIIITINYRLGPFGFVAHPSFVSESPRINYGLLDQQLAMQFVSNNAANLGGSRSNITLFGESAGGMSVCLHLIMPGSYGLFQRAIMESGPCLQVNLFKNTDIASATGVKLAEQLNCGTGTGASTATCLRKASTSAVMNALPLYNASSLVGIEWMPVIDGVSVQALPRKLFYSGKFQNKVQVMGGSCLDGGSLFTDWSLDFFSYGTLMAESFGPYAATIETTYAPITYNSPMYPNSWSAMLTDSFFVCPFNELARIYASKQGASSVHSFIHNKRPSFATTNYPVKYWGVYHTSELAFVFGHPPMKNISLTSEEQGLSDTVMKYVAGFARNGDPNTAGVPYWPKFSSSNHATMMWQLPQPATTQDYHDDDCDFWRTLADSICTALPCKCDGSC